MTDSLKRTVPVAVGVALFALLLLQAGCNKSDSAGAAGGESQASAAQATFKANCNNCHALGGVGGGRAPDLTHIGGEAEHTQNWIANYIKHPGSQRMPSFDGKIADADIQTLAAYLASQK